MKCRMLYIINYTFHPSPPLRALAMPQVHKLSGSVVAIKNFKKADVKNEVDKAQASAERRASHLESQASYRVFHVNRAI